MPDQRRPTRILIVDDHPAVREALALRISRHPDLTVCGEAADLKDALRLLEEAAPDLAVVDISLKNSNGIELIKRIRDRNDRVRILVWSMHSESLYAERALRAGAQGYVHKEEATDRIIDAVRRVLAGKLYVNDATAERMLQRSIRGAEGAGRSPVESLTDRELEVFRLIGEGVKTADVADRMHLSVKTVETYRDRIRQKLDLSNSVELAHQAAKWVFENP